MWICFGPHARAGAMDGLFHRQLADRSSASHRSSGSVGIFDSCQSIRVELARDRSHVRRDLVRRCRAKQYAQDPGASHSPGKHHDSNRGVQPRGNRTQGVNKVEISLELCTLKHWILVPTVGFREPSVTRHRSGEKSFHQRPVHDDADRMLAAPRQKAILKAPLQHVIGHLAGRGRAYRGKPLQLFKRDIGTADEACFSC